MRLDGWTNLLTGMGTNRDKRTASRYTGGEVLTQNELDLLYRGDSLAAKVVDLLPQDMTREGIKFQMGDDAEEAKAVMKALRDLQAMQAMKEGLSWARLYGGSVVVLGVNDGQSPEKPLNEGRIQEVKFLTVLDRWQVQPETYYEDSNLAKFGKPELYRLTPIRGSGGLIHETRLIRFDGVELPDRVKLTNSGWGDSVINRVFNALRGYHAAHDAAGTILSEFIVGIYRLKGLAASLSQGGKDAQTSITNRFQIMDLVKSVFRGILLDENEVYERHSANVSGLDKLIEAAERRLVAETGIPHTILLGEAPGASLGENGNSERTDWYDFVKSQQEDTLREPLERLITLLLKARRGPTSGHLPGEWGITFNPLWQLSEDEQAEIRYKQAQTDQIYILTGVASPEEIGASRFGGDSYSTDTVLWEVNGGDDEQAEEDADAAA